METIISRALLTFLVNALWQVPLVVAAALVALRLMRHAMASYRHAVLLTALGAAVLVPLASIQKSQPSAAVMLPRADRLQPSSVLSAVVTPTAQATPAPRGRLSRPVALPGRAVWLILLAYGVFVVAALVRFGRALRQTSAIRSRTVRCPLPPVLRTVHERCRRAFGLAPVELLSSPIVRSPLTVGVWRPAVILPDSLIEETSEDVLTTAIGHEMAHIARRDYLIAILCRLLYLPISFHPAAWWLHRRLEATREMACDELVTHRLLDATVYARSIVSIAATMTAVPAAGFTLGVFDGNILEQRIRRLLSRPPASIGRSRALFVGGISALLLCASVASALALAARAQDEQTKVTEALARAGQILRKFSMEKASPDNGLLAAARDEYLAVLALDQWNKPALGGMITLAMYAKHPEDGVEWAQKLIQADPRDKETHYTAAVLDWAIAYPEFVKARDASGAQPSDTFLRDASARERLRAAQGARVEEGVRLLETALTIDPKYDDAMAYLNLMYRLKAAMADNELEAKQFMDQADAWVGKAIAIKQAKDTPAPGAAARSVMVPPPPPPPPGQNPKLDLPADDSPPPARLANPSPGSYWQVMGPDATTPARALFDTLKAKGFQVAYVAVPPEAERVRVVVGPYFTNDAVMKAKAVLTAAGFRPLRVW